jgi:hypothetical protein
MLPDEPMTLIPYALWNNRGPGQMMVWIPFNEKSAKPLPAPTIAFKSKITASKRSRALSSIVDQYEPLNSNDHSYPYYHWWPDNNRWEWIQYDFEKPQIISRSKVYWFDDGPWGGCRIPDEYEILYNSGGSWNKVAAAGPLKISKDSWNIVEFKPVRAVGIKLRIKLNKDFSSGVHEWIVE